LFDVIVVTVYYESIRLVGLFFTRHILTAIHGLYGCVFMCNIGLRLLNFSHSFWWCVVRGFSFICRFYYDFL